MGIVIRLKDDVTKMLQTYSPDPNEAIRTMNSIILLQKGEVLALKNTNPATINVPIRDLVSDFQPDTSFHPVVTPEKSRLQLAKEAFANTPVPDSGVPTMFNDAYWKKLKEVVGEAIDPQVGR